MTESIHFHTDLYSRDAVEIAAQKYRVKARIEVEESLCDIVTRLESLSAAGAEDLSGELGNEVLSAMAMQLRSGGCGDAANPGYEIAAEPPWQLLAPFVEASDVGLGWALESLSPVRSGAATLLFRHPQHGTARVAIRRHTGTPVGVAHTDDLDFMVMNGGGGTTQTEASIAIALLGLADTLRAQPQASIHTELLDKLLPHVAETSPGGRKEEAAAAPQFTRRIAPSVDPNTQTICFDLAETAISRLALYDAVLAFADRCYIFLTRPDSTRIGVRLRPKGESSTEALRWLTRDVTNVLNQLARRSRDGSRSGNTSRRGGLPALEPQRVDMDALLAELEAAAPETLGVGFQPERGPGHENLRVLNILGTGACNSDCVFCVEKFNPSNRLMPSADATRQLILNSAGQFDMLFFASGEPTIHPKLFDHVNLARSVGFTCFGMSSHFRTFADPRFTLKTLQAGFEYFDISLHAADRNSQLAVNPIEDDGQSLFEALKGLAVLFRLADVLGIRISVTQKIVVSRLNVTQLESIFRATYERGVRHFIVQPVRPMGLSAERQAMLDISEEEILPHLNTLLEKTAGSGAVIKPYGFSRERLFASEHVESEQNRVKNIFGKARQPRSPLALPKNAEEQPGEGRYWIELRAADQSFGFASDGSTVVLDEALQRGAVLPFGCRMGSCGMCCARLVEGDVDQSTGIFLSQEQQQQGFVLLCQARPLSDVCFRMCTDDEIDQL